MTKHFDASFRTTAWRFFLAAALAVSLSAQPAPDPAAAPARAAPLEKETETIDIGDGVTMEFVLIRPGSFQMGSERNQSDEKAVHKVTLTQPYYLGKYEVTQEQWEKVMGYNPSHFKGPKLPVENVSWEDCQQFLAALSKKVGRKFVLPTEAQWEYACRAGTTTHFSHGDDEATLGEYSWHSGNSDLTTHPVGEKKPNPWGLYDIHGNVFEWCQDWYYDVYPRGDAVDPKGPAKGTRRVIRGGAWLYVIDNHRSSDRGFSPPDYRINEYGLRCVLQIHEDAATESGASVAPTEVKDPIADVFTRLDAAVAAANKLYAEMLLAEAEKLSPADARLGSLRSRVADLRAPQEKVSVEIAPGVTMEFVLIRPGSFTMGSDQSPILNEKPAHRVTLTQPFYMGKFEVTQKQWTSVMGRNLSAFKGGASVIDAAQLPVENVSWLLCQSFMTALNQKNLGYTFRLPTEAEWEYACRAGSTGEHSFPEGAALEDYAWFGGNAEGTTHVVGTKKPNTWGLHDMYGNVWEWCQDHFNLYRGEAEIDPAGPDHSSAGTRVVRGGGWSNLAKHVNSTFRHDVSPEVVMRYYGFRVVATPVAGAKE
jgi:formylglycine-generating enzyme required for sulfatase activity